MSIKLKNDMAKEICKTLKAESEREARGVDWVRYQAVCDELEGAQYDVELLEKEVAALKAKLVELTG